MEKNKQAHIKIVTAAYLGGYKIFILFSNNRMKTVDFTPAIQKYAKGGFAIYAEKARLKKFSIENGNIVWGENWDLIFPVADIFDSRF